MHSGYRFKHTHTHPAVSCPLALSGDPFGLIGAFSMLTGLRLSTGAWEGLNWKQ